MTPSLMTKPINDMDSGSIQGKVGSKPVRPKNSDQQEPFKIPSPENESQKSEKSRQTDDHKDEKKVDKSLPNDPVSDPSAQINPLAGSVPPPADPGTDKPDPLKSANPGDNLFMSADLKLPGGEATLSNQKAPSLIEEELQAAPGNQTAIGGQDKKNPMTFKLNEGNGKPGAIPAAMEPADKKDLSLLDKSISDLLIKGAVGVKSGDEKENSGNSMPEGSLSDQSGSAGSFSLIQLDKSPESAPSQSFSAIHKNEEGLNNPPVSTHDLFSEEKQILQQLTGWLTSHRSNELQSIRLNLSPETLGTIQIDLSVQNQQVKAELVASSAEVKELLEKHQDLLRNGLADNGLRVDQFTVRLEETAAYQAGGSMNFNNRFFQRESQPTSNLWSQNASVTTFTPITYPADATGKVSGHSQGGISIYI